MNMLDKCRSEDYVAGEHGANKDFNPEEPGSAEHIAWNMGWEEANEDYKASCRSYEGSDNGDWALFIIVPVLLFILFGIGKLVWSIFS